MQTYKLWCIALKFNPEFLHQNFRNTINMYDGTWNNPIQFDIFNVLLDGPDIGHYLTSDMLFNGLGANARLLYSGIRDSIYPAKLMFRV